jgi:hypothetical protein
MSTDKKFFKSDALMIPVWVTMIPLFIPRSSTGQPLQAPVNHRETKLSAILSGTEENGSIIDAFLTPDATTSLNSSPRMGIMFYQFHFDAAAWSVRVENDEEKVTVVNPLLQTFFEVEHNKERKFLYNDHIFVEPLAWSNKVQKIALIIQFETRRQARRQQSASSRIS